MPAHGHPVLSVATQTNSEVFASCADSNEVLVWDARLEKPAHRKHILFAKKIIKSNFILNCSCISN